MKLIDIKKPNPIKLLGVVFFVAIATTGKFYFFFFLAFLTLLIFGSFIMGEEKRDFFRKMKVYDNQLYPIVYSVCILSLMFGESLLLHGFLVNFYKDSWCFNGSDSQVIEVVVVTIVINCGIFLLKNLKMFGFISQKMEEATIRIYVRINRGNGGYYCIDSPKEKTTAAEMKQLVETTFQVARKIMKDGFKPNIILEPVNDFEWPKNIVEIEKCRSLTDEEKRVFWEDLMQQSAVEYNEINHNKKEFIKL